MRVSGFFLVSGSLGRIGSAIVSDLIAQGESVVGMDVRLVNDSDCQRDEQSNFIQVSGNSSSIEEVSETIEMGEKKFGCLKGAAHAAYPRTADWGCNFWDLNENSLSTNLSMQLGGTIIFSQQVARALERNHGGSLVLLSSIQAIRGPRFHHYIGTQMSSPAEYSAIKAGVIGFTKWLAKYMAGSNVRVNCVSPGGIKSDQPEEFVERYRQDCLSKGLLAPEDIVGAIRFLLSEDSRYMSGQNLIVDDGWSL